MRGLNFFLVRRLVARLTGLSLLVLLLQIGLTVQPGLADSAQAQSDLSTGPGIQYFSQTGHNVSGLFYADYLQTGGLSSNGLPLTEEFKDSTGMTVQVFERAVFELHQPLEGDGSGGAQPQPYVAHKLLGSLMTAGEVFSLPTVDQIPLAQHYFPQTGHTLNNGFATYWETHGGLAEFGYPLSEEFQETNPDDGKTYTVQYFERNRFEYHPDQRGTPYEVQLGLLGRTYASQNYDPALLAAVKPLTLGPQTSLRIPSLMYHHIRELSDNADLNAYSVTPEALVQQLNWLQDNGYHTVTVAQIDAYLKYGVPLPSKPINLRFDDGWANQLFAAQELKKRGMTATFYIITQAHTFPYMTQAQVKQLDTEGFEIGSHTRNHPFLTRNTAAFDWEQIKGSKDDLEKLLGHPVLAFAYPYGDHNPAVDKQVQQAGYSEAVTIGWSEFWKATTPFDQPTVSVSDIRTLNAFIGRVNTTW